MYTPTPGDVHVNTPLTQISIAYLQDQDQYVAAQVGPVIEETIYHDAGETTPQGMTRKQLCRLITEAGRVPVERDTLYRAVTRTEESFTVAV